jgi:asparagine synthase (glutamine-hydrolysing)
MPDMTHPSFAEPAAAAEAADAQAPPLKVDRFALQTLCWRDDGGRLRTDARADRLAGDAPDLDPQAVLDYLFFHAIPAPRTVFKGVQRLPAGHSAQWDGSHLHVQAPPAPAFEPDRSRSFEDLREAFRAALKAAVADALHGGTGPAACFLSGGTDSSTIAGMIGLVAGQAAQTYSIGFEAEGYDEMAYARIAARHFGTRHHEHYVTPDQLVHAIPEVAASYDQPFGNSSAVPAYICAQVAKADGVTRLLAGDGGDELFGGNTRYAKQKVFEAYGAVPSALRGALLQPLLQGSPLGALPLLRKGRSYIEQARVPLPARLHMYNLLLRLGVDEVLEPGFLARVDLDDPLRQCQAVWDATGDAGTINRMLAFDWRYTLAENDIPKVRETTALAGVEVRYPLLDERLVALSLQLPEDMKLRGLKLRWFFKEALRGFLPDAILTKKKQGFGLPFGVWVTRHAGLRALAEDSVRSFATRGVVRPAFVAALFDRHLQQHPGYYGEMLWILMMLEQWLRAHAPGYRCET